jgi:lincosamide nucleotidyltransferase A/C/D/E
MAAEPEMSSSDLIELLHLIDEASIDVWLDGGWGVDALLGRQTRRHKDADIILRVSDVPKLREILGRRRFVVKDGYTTKLIRSLQWLGA